MKISKHHYANELAKNGYSVFFLNPLPADWKFRRRRFCCIPSEVQGLQVIQHAIPFPYNIKFHVPFIFQFLIGNHVRKLEEKFGPFSLVWSFDLNDSIPLRYFSSKTKKIFFAADWPKAANFKAASQGADLIASVAPEILRLYGTASDAKLLLLHHGVASCFLTAADAPFEPVSQRVKVGMTGNLLRPDINRAVLCEIIDEHPDLDFEFFGAFNPEQSNLGCEFDSETSSFISFLQQSSHVTLHGPLMPEDLAIELRRIDLFLICYDESRDQSKATNYHKISEFLAYNRPIISNRVSAHAENTLVIQTPNSVGEVDVKSNFSQYMKDYNRLKTFENKHGVFSYSKNLDLIMFKLKKRHPD